MSGYETMYTNLLNAISDQGDEEWKINLLATFAAPSLDDKVKQLLTQNKNNIEVLPKKLEGSLFDYKNDFLISTDIPTEEENDVDSSQYIDDTISVSNTGY